MSHSRRNFLRNSLAAAGLAGSGGLTPLLRQALAVEPQRTTGSLQDVQHIVVLMQENRSFDHYFGAARGVRGFADRFPIPIASLGAGPLRHVFEQPGTDDPSSVVRPFHLDTQRDFGLMRSDGAAHTWPDAQQAWANGKLNQWTLAKGEPSMAYFARDDIPFHYALADAFTVCDAYHCSLQGGTSPNRLFLWTGSNDPQAQGHGPATFNDLKTLTPAPGRDSYTWTTYPERLQAAGIRWQVYQDIDNNYDDNSLAFFQAYRDAYAELPGSSAALRERATSTRNLDQLRADVLANQLPQVSWIVAPELDSEHPDNSSPAQGADYTAHVLQALTANPEVWSQTVLIVNFDENDGFFDHMPPPAAPSYIRWHPDPAQAVLAGASTVDTQGEYHEKLVSYRSREQDKALLHQPYGLGPRVPLLVISPWSRGGWVNSQVFDHTSVIRLMEQRFGVHEPNISAWRRAVCGDLTSTLDFSRPNSAPLPLWPATEAVARRAAALGKHTTPTTPATPQALRQEPGTRPSRPLPYELHASGHCDGRAMLLRMANTGRAAAVFHVYDRLQLDAIPRRYTVGPERELVGSWGLVANASQSHAAYDLWVLGPNGFHRHLCGSVLLQSTPGAWAQPESALDLDVTLNYWPAQGEVELVLTHGGSSPCIAHISANAYQPELALTVTVPARGRATRRINVRASGHWYDLSVRSPAWPDYTRRFAGRMETGQASSSDPALG